MNIASKAAAFCVFAFFGATAWAGEFPKPTGAPLLTVSGEIGGLEPDETIQFDLAGLETFGTTEIETTTIWTDGKQVFSGVSLEVLVDALGVDDGTIRASAINDYLVEIPVSDAVTNGPIIAYRVNGKEMSIRDKGPLWLIYPYDSNADYRSEVIYSRSIWQMDRMEFAD